MDQVRLAESASSVAYFIYHYIDGDRDGIGAPVTDAKY